MIRRPRDIKIEMLRFFKDLYSQKSTRRVHIDTSMLPKISSSQAQILEMKPTREEISLALKECDSDTNKAPGYDGFNFKFVKKMWQDIGNEVCDLIDGFFDSGIFPKEINQTWVALIPKVEGDVEIKDFRPITFVKHRQILDGALIANEVVWWGKKNKPKMVILKIDSQKAYDAIRWDFLRDSFWNGFRFKEDPLSPFLFLLVAETFNRLVIRGREIGVLDGIYIGRDRVPVTHLPFADDTLIFAKNYKKLLNYFALTTWLRINYGKSVLIPIGCGQEWIEDILAALKCGVAKLPISYLGIPLGANPKKSATWKPIIEKAKCVRTYLKLEDGQSIITEATQINIKLQYSSPRFLVTLLFSGFG
ncbi:hypothetical protein SASPL_114755 [Salvia splendens]|uniref:Reverse transcriptase domain-containing protein n=1 Tax=Salvia splendens TaxID=180675 RepID=A0A8X8Y6P0_SALSN|nr:hypothetical protein SASPL_114755 [Salvia splendens]